ncbi:hypothetical protein, partial [Gluconobacter frateurii]
MRVESFINLIKRNTLNRKNQNDEIALNEEIDFLEKSISKFSSELSFIEETINEIDNSYVSDDKLIENYNKY